MKLEVLDYQSNNIETLAIESLRSYGFLVLSDIPISESRIHQVYEQWKGFFNSDEKYQYLYSTDMHDGFRPIEQAEVAKDHHIKDLKEMYHYYPYGRCPEELKVVTQDMFIALERFAGEILKWIDHALPPSIRSKLSCPLPDMIIDSPNTLYRLLHYPPLSGDETPGAIRASAHSDICLLTLLPAATSRGLQIQNKSGNWLDVPVKAGSFIVNIGDMLEECTEGYFPSTPHRVMNPENESMKESRLSMPLFLHPRDDVVLSERHTALSYRTERLRELGLL